MGDVVAQYGLQGLLGVVVIGALVWGLVHLAAEPGSEVKLLFGLASYKKRAPAPPPSAAKSRATAPFKPIDVIHAHTPTLWRIVVPPHDWIEDDLSRSGPGRIDSLLAGPYHARCKMDLSYFDADIDPSYRVHRKCPSCAEKILPKTDGVDDRFELKWAVIQLVQQAHMLGQEIKSGLIVPVEQP